MIGYADSAQTPTIEKDIFGGATTWLGSPQLDRGLRVKSVVNPHACTAKGDDATPGNHAWRPPDW